MSDFDPDAFLAATAPKKPGKAPAAAFDPDAFLGATRQPRAKPIQDDPDEPVANPPNWPAEGNPNLPQLATDLTKANKGPGFVGGLANAASAVGKAAAEAPGDAARDPYGAAAALVTGGMRGLTFGALGSETPEQARERIGHGLMFAARMKDKATYQRLLDEKADLDKRAPHAFLGGVGELAGSFANPAARAAKATSAALPAAEGIIGGTGRAIVSGAVGAGTDAAGRGIVEGKPLREIGRDIADSATTVAPIAAAGAAAGETLRKLGQGAMGGLRQRILNEVADGGADGAKTTPTKRKLLDKAGDAIYDEVVHGPDAKAVRAAYAPGAQHGIDTLQPIIDKVGDKLHDAYTVFEEHGKGLIDERAYVAKLTQAWREAPTLTEKLGLEAMGQNLAALSERNGGKITLRDLRAFTTDTQAAASGALGGLNQGTPLVKLKGKLAAVAGQAMSDTITETAAGHKALEAAAKEIATNNPRMSALLTITDGLKQRAYKEASRGGPLERAAKTIVGGATGATAGAVLTSDDDDKARNAVLAGLAGAGLVRGGRAADRGVTSLAINAARGEAPLSLTRAQQAAQGLARFTAAEELQRRRQQGDR